jgi:hypothetical protein
MEDLARRSKRRRSRPLSEVELKQACRSPSFTFNRLRLLRARGFELAAPARESALNFKRSPLLARRAQNRFFCAQALKIEATSSSCR